MTSKDKKGIAIIIGVVICFVSLFALRSSLNASANNYDHDNLCPREGNYPVIKVVIDKTDPFDKQTSQRLAKLIRKLKDTLQAHERLSIHVLDETGTYSPSPVFDMCNPGRGDQANSLYENPRRIQMCFEEKFATPLEIMLEDLLRPGIAPQSPILETAISLRTPGKNERLVIVSDMMQNSENVSFYGGSISASDQTDELCEMADQYEEIQIYYINRTGIRVATKQKVRNFWHQCLGRISREVTWETL